LSKPSKYTKRAAEARRQRRRERQKDLWTLQPGGSMYDSWWHVQPGQDVEEWARLAGQNVDDEETAALVARVPYYAKVYGANIPIIAAEFIDEMVERGTVGILRGAEPGEPTPREAKPVPIEELVPPGGFEDGMTMRDCMHTLHADGWLIVECPGVVALGTPWYLKDRKRRVAAGELSDVRED
jgi:hypothetical protein